MEYSRIRNAINREITIPSCSLGKICKLPNGFIAMTIVRKSATVDYYSIEVEILNKHIFTIKSSKTSEVYSTTNDTFSIFTKVDQTNNETYLYFTDNFEINENGTAVTSVDSLTSSTNPEIIINIRYTTEGIEFIKDESLTNDNFSDILGNIYYFDTFYTTQDTFFTNNTNITVDDFSVERLHVNEIKSDNTEINTENANITAGQLTVNQAYLEVAHVDTFNSKTITTNTIKVGNWTLAKDSNNNDRISISYSSSNN